MLETFSVEWQKLLNSAITHFCLFYFTIFAFLFKVYRADIVICFCIQTKNLCKFTMIFGSYFGSEVIAKRMEVEKGRGFILALMKSV